MPDDGGRDVSREELRSAVWLAALTGLGVGALVVTAGRAIATRVLGVAL